MHSFVLMLALSAPSATPEVPDDTVKSDRFGNHLQSAHYRGGRGCSGCSGGGCHGRRNGCSGGGCHGGGYGCGGGGYGCGGGGYGCGGGGYGGYGCGGGYASGGCSGYGGGGGYAYGGGYGGHYAGLSGWSGASTYAGSYGITLPGGWSQNMTTQYGSFGPTYTSQGVVMPYVQGSAPGAYQAYYAGDQGGAAGNAATLIVEMPADARLTIDGTETQQRGQTRTFVTPPLQPGKEYTYTLKASGSGGQDASKQVTVRPGQETRVSLDMNNRNRSED